MTTKKRKGQPGFSLAETKAEVLRMDPAQDQDSESFRCSVALLSALAVGTGAGPISKFTGYDRSEVESWVENWKKSGVFKGRKVRCTWFDEDGGVSFILDSLVGLGLVERAS